MTLAVENPRVLYAGDGATDTFPITFEFFGDEDFIEVVLKDDSVVPFTEAVLSNGVDYNVVGTDVVMVDPPDADEELLIRRNISLEQIKDYIEAGSFLQEDHEDGIDRIVAMVQQLNEIAARALKFKKSSAEVNPTMDDPDDGKVLGWNASGDIVNVDLIVGSTGPQGPQGDPGPLPTFSDEIPVGAINGLNDTFTIANAPAAGSFILFKNGNRLRGGGVHYTLSGTTITMVTAPLASEQLDCNYAY